MEKTVKQLESAYAKRFKTLNKTFFMNRDTGIKLFVEYLKYIRDYLIISDIEVPDNSKTKIATITAAITEFYACQTSIDKEQKNFHWNNFCEFVKLNMEEWLTIDDTV